MANELVKFLNVKSVSKRYEVSVPTIWRWIREKKYPPPIKINGSARWNIDDVIEWDRRQVEKFDISN